jgi:2-dehydro-3-deoxygluconokinase
MPQIACIGEVMIELSPFSQERPELKNMSFAGDTYNTAVTLARLGAKPSYVTRLGKDPYSQEILTRLNEEGVETEGISYSDSKVPGLYMIHNQPDGERVFFYWRSNSAARDLYRHEGLALATTRYLESCDWIYLSGISLAIISIAARKRLYQALDELRAQGKKVCFDGNFRPRLWQNLADAQASQMEMMRRTDLALMTLDDEEILWGSDGDPIEEAKERYRGLECNELVLKRGDKDVVVIRDQALSKYPVPPINNVVDTTAAGDTFNAGYLSARIAGKSIDDCVNQAIRCAGVIIQHRGGVIDKQVFLSALKI